ncbi:TolC family protein [Parabacteroides sp. Marseille-P3160]|uniref:TolC family protein n=2 Tax=Parabacteroides sp. Marseille-P3160 TaxID=1917887 RepID=UPI0009BA916C|nr:TolC family protein [Parabacteroides sp. Marseille-P3160]
MKQISKCLLAGLVLCCNPLQAQQDMAGVLKSIERNNRELQANREWTVAQKLDAQAGNNLEDPSVSYTHQYGNKEGLGIQGELIASQAFDFPSLYVQRNQWAKIKSEELDYRQTEKRQEILMEAQLICLDLVQLNRKRQLLEERRENAEQLSALYAQRLEKGDANILETNKIRLELLNIKTEARLTEAERTAKLQALAALNGGEAISFTDTAYRQAPELLSFEELKAEALAATTSLKALEQAQLAAQRYVGVSKAQGLPGFEVGYRLNTAVGGERFNGFLVGIRVPLFSNRNRVKQAKAQSLYTELQLETASTALERKLQGLYLQSLALKKSVDEYRDELGSRDNTDLLNKALHMGQISMIEYFVNIMTYYQSIDNYLQLQNQYQKVMAELYRFRL